MRSKIFLITARRANYLLPRKARLYLVSFFWENDLGAEGLLLFGCHEGIRHDDDRIPHMYQVRRCTVHADTARTAFAGNDIGLQTGSVVIVHYLHPLACHDA